MTTLIFFSTVRSSERAVICLTLGSFDSFGSLESSFVASFSEILSFGTLGGSEYLQLVARFHDLNKP